MSSSYSRQQNRHYQDEDNENDGDENEDIAAAEDEDPDSSTSSSIIDDTDEGEDENDEDANQEVEEEEDDHRADQQDDMDLLYEFSRHQQYCHSAHARQQHPNQVTGSLACLCCKEVYTPRTAGTCRECYDEASETKEALKKEIEELQARIVFLKTWAPEAMEEDCADIVLECSDGSKIRAHRAILISRSSVFKAMLESRMEESRTNTIKITDFTYDVLRLFVHYLYSAEIYPESLEECACDMLALAEKYNVKQLKYVCERYMISKLSNGNALSNFEYASLYGARTLKQAALNIIIENIQELMGNNEYQDLVNRDAKLVVEIFESYLAKQLAKNPTQRV